MTVILLTEKQDSIASQAKSGFEIVAHRKTKQHKNMSKINFGVASPSLSDTNAHPNTTHFLQTIYNILNSIE